MATLAVIIDEKTYSVLQRMSDEGIGQAATPDPQDAGKLLLGAKLTPAQQAARILNEWAIGMASEYRTADLRKVPAADIDALIAAKKQAAMPAEK